MTRVEKQASIYWLYFFVRFSYIFATCMCWKSDHWAELCSSINYYSAWLIAWRGGALSWRCPQTHWVHV